MLKDIDSRKIKDIVLKARKKKPAQTEMTRDHGGVTFGFLEFGATNCHNLQEEVADHQN